MEALARYGQEPEQKVRALLSQKVTDYTHNPMTWLEPLAVRLAGQARLDATIPLIVAKLLEDGGDILNQECGEALTRIGAPAVLEAVAEAFPTAEQHFRIYASGPLEHIHSDLAVEKCVRLLAQEKDHGIRRELAHALLCHFAPEGVEADVNYCWGENSTSRTKGCGITCSKLHAHGGTVSRIRRVAGDREGRERRNTGGASGSLKPTPRACCCSPWKS